MDYRQLMENLDLDTLREIARQREIRCSYLKSEENGPDHRSIIVKTLMGQMESADNIRKALLRLSESQLRILHQVLETGRMDEADEDLLLFGFFLNGGDGRAVFHEDVAECLADMETVRCGHVDAEQVVADRLAYGAYMVFLNGLLMRRLKCLVNQQPGKRMVECLFDRVPGGMTGEGFGYLYDFLIHTGLLSFEPETGHVVIPDELADRSFFYTNLFKYLQSGDLGSWLDQFKDATEGDPTILLNREQLAIPETTWGILCLTDTVKPMSEKTFVVTDLATAFFRDRSVPFPPSASGFFVVPGFKLIADRSADTELLSTLVRVTELERFDQVFQFTFNTCSLIHARRQGFTETEIVSFLNRHAACPDDLERMIHDTLARYGEIRIFAGYHALMAENPGLIDRLKSHEEIGRYVHMDGDNTLILDPSKSAREIQRLLVDLDFIPELHSNYHHVPVHREDMKDIQHFLVKLKEFLKRDPGPDVDKLQALFEKLRIQPDEPGTGTERTVRPRTKSELVLENERTIGLEDRMEILEFAIGRPYRVKIRYKQKGTEIMEDRLIDPRYFDGDFLVAYCENRQADRRFNIYRLELVALIVEDRQ